MGITIKNFRGNSNLSGLKVNPKYSLKDGPLVKRADTWRINPGGTVNRSSPVSGPFRSFSYWIKFNNDMTASSSFIRIPYAGDYITYGFGSLTITASGEIFTTINSSGPNRSHLKAASIPGGKFNAGQWYHFVLTSNSSIYTHVYINNVRYNLVASSGGTTAVRTSNIPFFRINGDTDNLMINDYIIYNRELLDNDVSQIYSGNTPTDGITARWDTVDEENNLIIDSVNGQNLPTTNVSKVADYPY